MADDFTRAMRERDPGSNADDPTADRMGAYPEAGELNSASPAFDRVGQERGSGTTANPSNPAGADAELIGAGGAGNPLGGWHATDPPGDPGLPGHDQPAEGGREQVDDVDGAEGEFVDRLGR